MIISFSKKFAFVATPKTGSQSIRKQIEPFLAKNDWEQSVFGKPRFFPVPELAEIGHGHLTVGEIEPYLLPGLWDRFFTFAFVRNPFDRFISFCHYYYHQKMHENADPCGAMKAIISSTEMNRHVSMQPQHHFLENEDGTIAVSFVGRFESLQKDFDHICRKMHWPNILLSRINASCRQPVAGYMDTELEDLIIDKYQRDFELFGYSRTCPKDI